MTSEQDEIDKSSAPLIEHLIELRRRLIWSIGAFFVAFIIFAAYIGSSSSSGGSSGSYSRSSGGSFGGYSSGGSHK